MIQDSSRQAARFAAKNESIARLVIRLGIALRGLLAQKPNPFRGKALHQVLPVTDNLVVQVLPVIQAGAPETLFIEPESQWAHEPEFGTECDAAATDVACILGNLRLVEDDMKLWIVLRHDSNRTAQAGPEEPGCYRLLRVARLT